MTKMRQLSVRRLLSRIFGRSEDLPAEARTKAINTPVAFYPDHVQERRPKRITIGAPLQVVEQIREQLEDHLTTINQNTDEIHANNEAIWQLNQKVNKLYEHIEELRAQMMSATHEPVRPINMDSYTVEPLTTREQEVFLILYTAEGFISQTEISRRLHLPASLIRQFLTTLMEKGVPLTRKGYGDEVLVRLDPSFKERQARENLAGISEQLTLALATTGTFG